MRRVAREIAYLTLTRQPEFDLHRVIFCSSFDAVLQNWRAGSRVSPVFPTVGASWPTADRFWITFAGPCHPGAIAESLPAAVFLAHGLFNILLVDDTEEGLARTRHEVENLGLPFEEWTVVGNLLEFPVKISVLDAQTYTPKRLLSSHFATDESAKEYSLLIGTAISRAAEIAPDLVTELRRFDDGMHFAFSSLKRPRGSAEAGVVAVVRQGVLVRANAALSRFTSQNLAGTSPILETESHFWTHSLLGVGCAGMGLERLRRFITEILTHEKRLLDRFRLLSLLAPSPTLSGLDTKDEIWRTDNLFRANVHDNIDPHTKRERKQHLPLITFLSGRDGFRSTDVGLSAPLEILTSANTTSWTLMTLTHEISHSYIAGALTILASPEADAHPRSRPATGRAEVFFEYLNKDLAILSALDSIREYFGELIWWLHDPAMVSTPTRDEFHKAIRKFHTEVEELLTHVFDFLYFYGANRSSYIRSIWASWGVIPNIESKVDHYILRSLCALFGASMMERRPMAESVPELIGHLEAVAKSFPKALYVSEAISRLKADPKRFERELNLRAGFVRIVVAFLYSPQIARALVSEPIATGRRAAEGYPIEVGAFGSTVVRNPLRFTKAYSDDLHADATKSFWLLQNLAFTG